MRLKSSTEIRNERTLSEFSLGIKNVDKMKIIISDKE